ncbi:MAG: SpoIID/LytB domain-containing protein [Oscillospiraceae bacterium]|nr:SpoIID/LytB domain-containing protein [Oscillospiraceae bacterium]
MYTDNRKKIAISILIFIIIIIFILNGFSNKIENPKIKKDESYASIIDNSNNNNLETQNVEDKNSNYNLDYQTIFNNKLENNDNHSLVEATFNDQDILIDNNENNKPYKNDDAEYNPDKDDNFTINPDIPTPNIPVPNIPYPPKPEEEINPTPPTTNLSDLTIKINGKLITDSPINIVSQVVSAEMSPNFHPEAIKAQAVASHSYIRYNNDKGIYPSVGVRPINDNIKNLSAQVINKLVYYNNEISNTVYHATSAGKTNASVDVWGGAIPYLISVDSFYDDGNRFSNAKNWNTKVIIDKNRIQNMVKKNANINLPFGKEKDWFQFLSQSQGGLTSGGYIARINLFNNTHANGKAITGRDIREKILVENGKFLLKSPKFDINYSDNNFIFSTYGYGHGVGMSQDGANGYAANSLYSYIDILKHYYTGVQVR